MSDILSSDGSSVPLDDVVIENPDILDSQDAQYMISLIRSIPGFPGPKVLFRDFIPVLNDAKGFEILIQAMADILPVSVDSIDYVGGLEARGFLVGAPLALKLHKGFVAFRKSGKLPPPTLTQEYDLEYGHAGVQIEQNVIKPGSKVLIVDDLIATGGTARAAAHLVETAGGVVAGFCFAMELVGLSGRASLDKYPTASVLSIPA
jgi:adenine phosphoribosyltransferase